MEHGSETVCPGCGLVMPRDATAASHAYGLSSPECWSVYGEVMAAELDDPVGLGPVHQLTVDAYFAQHPTGGHPDKSIAIHLVGLWLTQAEGLATGEVPRRQQRLATERTGWPHLEPPARRGSVTAFDVALASSREEHVALVRRWAAEVWRAWAAHHDEIARLGGSVRSG